MAKKQADVEKDKLQTAIDGLNKTYGIGTILTLDSKVSGEYDVISSGSIGFDWNTLGVGGFVKGRLYEVMGWEGTGKSTVCAHAVANCQKQGGVALYIDGEHAVDKSYFKAIGVDIQKMLIAQPNSGEEGFNIALKAIESGEVSLIIIDSDSSLIPQKVVDGEIGDSAIGKKAMLNSNSYPKLKSALVKSKTCMIVISQYREKIGVMFGNPTTTQGGHALKFYSDCRIEITRTLGKNGDVVYGNITKVKSIKNKMGSPFKTSQFDIIYGKGIDYIEEVITLLHDLELGKKWGSQMIIGDVKTDLNDFKKLLRENEEVFLEYKQQIIDKIKTDGL